MFSYIECDLVHNAITIGILNHFFTMRISVGYWWIILKKLLKAVFLQKVRS